MPTKTRTLLAEILANIGSELIHLELHKTKGTYICDLGGGVSGWLGLNVEANRRDGRVGVNPVVGVRHEQIERTVASLSEEKESHLTPTISTSLGYLMPQSSFLEWLFEPAPFDYPSECKKLVKAIEIYGIPFMRSNDTLEGILSKLEELRFTSKDAAAYRIPVAYLLSGKPELAASYSKKQLVGVEQRSDVAAQQYKTFTFNLLQSVSSLGKRM